MSLGIPQDRGVVIESEVVFTTGGPVTTVEYRSLTLGGNRVLQVPKEIVLLRDDDIEIFVPPTAVWVSLTRLPTFSVVRAHFIEVYGVDILEVPLEKVEELPKAVKLIALISIRGMPCINPRAINDLTRKIFYDNLL